MRPRLCRTTGVLPISRSGTLNAETISPPFRTVRIEEDEPGATGGFGLRAVAPTDQADHPVTVSGAAAVAEGGTVLRQVLGFSPSTGVRKKPLKNSPFRSQKKLAFLTRPQRMKIRLYFPTRLC
jgi:hypothetical protein